MELSAILALLQTAFAGVRKDVLTNIARTIAMAATTEDEAKELVGKLDQDKVNNFVKDYRSGIDKEISEANKTFERSLREKYDFMDKNGNGGTGDPGNGGGNGGSDDIETKIANAMAKAMAPMTAFMEKMTQKDIMSARRTQINDVLSKIPESQRQSILKDFERMSFADDAAFTDYLTEKKEYVDAYVQETADNDLLKNGKVSFGKVDKDGMSAGVADYIKSLSEDSGSNLGGKKL